MIYEQRTSPEQGELNGLGNIEPQFNVTPAHLGKFIWAPEGRCGCRRQPMTHWA